MRKARFRTVISLIINGEENQFEGIVEGEIILDIGIYILQFNSFNSIF